MGNGTVYTFFRVKLTAFLIGSAYLQYMLMISYTVYSVDM
jgi:hypothetical protein